MVVMNKDGIEYIERNELVKEWRKNEQYKNLLEELGKSLHIENHIKAKIKEIEENS